MVSEHGILHERFAELATDSVRAALLNCAGYKSSVVEFIDLEHTARNLLIRAVRRRDTTIDSSNQKYRQQLQQYMNDFNLPPLKLQRILEESGVLPA